MKKIVILCLCIFTLTWCWTTALDTKYQEQKENMELLMSVKKETYIVAQKHKTLMQKYQELQKINNKLYNEILAIVNAWSTNQPLQSLGLAQEQQLPKLP